MIGVSYRGHDGRRQGFSVDGAEEAAEAMRRVSANDSQGILARARRPGAEPPAAAPAAKGDRPSTLPGGSVAASADGRLCLRGEELSPLIPGRRLFAARDGDKGFFTLDEFDPPVKGAPLGKDTGDRSQSLDPDPDRRDAPDGSAWSLRVQTDERAEEDPATGAVTVYKYFRRLHFSAAGRCVAVGGEWREIAFKFTPGSGGGRWCVRPVFSSDGALAELQFGESRILDAAASGADAEESGAKVVGTTQCPNGREV